MTSPDPLTAVEPPFGDERVRLLGLAAYAELSAFEHLASGAVLAPDLADRIGVLGAAAVRMDHHRRLAAQLEDSGTDPVVVMGHHSPVVDDYHARTTPRGWPEFLVKAWAVDGLASDFYAEVADLLPDPLGTVVRGLAGPQLTDFARERVTVLLHDEPALGGRLRLWARRVVGEAMTRTQRLAAEDEAIAGLVTGTLDTPETGLAELHALIARVLQRHNDRMATAGLLA